MNFLSTISNNFYRLVAAGTPTLKIPEGGSMDQVAGGIINVILKIAFYVGGVLAIYGIFQLVMAFKDENPDGKIKGVTLTIVGLALACLQWVLSISGIVSFG